LNVPVPKKSPNGIEGHIVHIDRYGNVISNIAYPDVQGLLPQGGDPGSLVLTVAGKTIKGLKKFYTEAAPGEPGAIINSSGYLEIFLFKQNARTALSVKRGDIIGLSLQPST
jgi:S-adenosylmethionine hydrolase